VRAAAPSTLEQRVDLRRTHDSAVTHEGFVVVVDGVAVVEVVHHDAEGFLHAAWRVVAEPIDSFEPRAIAEVKTRDGVDAYRGLPRQIAGAKPQARACAASRSAPGHSTSHRVRVRATRQIGRASGRGRAC